MPPQKFTIEDAPQPAGGFTISDASSAPAPSTGPVPSWWDRATAPFTTIEKPDPNHPWALSEAGKAVGNIGAGGLGVLLHPINTLEGIGGMVTAPIEMMEGTPFSKTVPGEAIQSLKDNPYGTVEAGIGQAAALPAAVEVAKGAVSSVPAIAKTGAMILSGTTPRLAEGLAEETSKANTEAAAKNSQALQKSAQDRIDELHDHFQKVQDVRAKNEAAQAVQSRRTALDRGVEQLDPQFQSDLKETEKNVRAQGNDKYAVVRQALGPKVDDSGNPLPGTAPTVPSGALADAVKTAESKIQGSSENLKIFRDILSKNPEGEPDSVEYQGAQIPKGHPLYEILTQGREGEGATFNDLQGYYSELGDKLSSGNLPGDVYQAMKSLQGSIGDLMQKMADSHDVGAQLKDAQNYWRDYMQTFRESQSPIYKAMAAGKNLKYKAGDSIRALQGRDEAIQALARYNPELARRANTIRGYQAEAKAIPSKPPVVKPEPQLSPSTPPKLADMKKIGLQDIRGAKQEAIAKSKGLGKLGTLGEGAGVWHMISSAMYGNPEGVLRGGVVASIPFILNRVLKTPAVVKILSEPTPADIAQIPPEIRGDLPAIVNAAKAQGIKVHPAIAAMAAAQTQTNAQ